ncbi:MAG: hypothetical protein P8046_05215 [Anaerolineales bacterium]
MSDERFALTAKFQESANAFAQALIQPINQELPKFFEQEDAAQGQDAYLAQVSAGVSPKAASFTDFFARNPYSNPEMLKTNIHEAAERGWIDLAEEGFTATPKAQTFCLPGWWNQRRQLMPLAKNPTLPLPATLSTKTKPLRCCGCAGT